MCGFLYYFLSLQPDFKVILPVKLAGSLLNEHYSVAVVLQVQRGQPFSTAGSEKIDGKIGEELGR